MKLEDQQKKLKLEYIDFDLDATWLSSRLIERLRKELRKYLANCWHFDPQDLEHQVLFRLTCYDPAEINKKLIEEIVEEQKYLIHERLAKLDVDLDWLFRGLSGRFPDLNCQNRLTMRKEDGCLYAAGHGVKIPVDFRKIDDEKIIRVFTGELHYIHQERNRGEVLGFFFRGDKYPFAVETTEPSVNVRQYKRDALLATALTPRWRLNLLAFTHSPEAPRTPFP